MQLSTAQRATITVTLDGADVGGAYNFSFSNPVANIDGGYLVGLVAGDADLTVSAGGYSVVIPIHVTGNPDHLVVTFGTPEPK